MNEQHTSEPSNQLPVAWALRTEDPDPQYEIEFSPECPIGWIGKAHPLFEGPCERNTVDGQWMLYDAERMENERLRAENESLKSEYNQCSGLLDDALRSIEVLEQQLESAKRDAAVGDWLCNYMVSEQVDLDATLVWACAENDPVKFKAAILVVIAAEAWAQKGNK